MSRAAVTRRLRLPGRFWSASPCGASCGCVGVRGVLAQLSYFVVNTALVTDEEDDGFAPVAPLNDQLMCGLCEDCTMDAHEDEDGQQVPGLAVHICEGCQGGYHSHCIRDRLGPAAEVSGLGLSDVSWIDLSLVERRSTWRCGTVLKMISGEAARWWSLCSHSAPLGAQQDLPRTPSSLTSTLT